MQKLFKFKDGERIVARADARSARDACRRRRCVAVTQQRLRPALRARAAHRGHDARPAAASRKPQRGRRGRRRACRATTATSSCVATRDGHVLRVQGRRDREARPAPGRGVTVIKLERRRRGDRLRRRRQGRRARASRPRRAASSSRSAPLRSRSARAAARATRSSSAAHARRVVPQPVTIQPLANAEGGQGVN